MLRQIAELSSRTKVNEDLYRHNVPDMWRAMDDVRGQITTLREGDAIGRFVQWNQERLKPPAEKKPPG